MGGHVFISYSHADGNYVERLKRHLEHAGLTVWTDGGIDYGSRWPDVIATHIDDCAAFVPVMSPRSRRSEWVEREILYAQDNNKPILPLLLEGKRILQLINVQDEVVTGGRLPSKKFVDNLRELAGMAPIETHWVLVEQPDGSIGMARVVCPRPADGDVIRRRADQPPPADPSSGQNAVFPISEPHARRGRSPLTDRRFPRPIPDPTSGLQERQKVEEAEAREAANHQDARRRALDRARQSADAMQRELDELELADAAAPTEVVGTRPQADPPVPNPIHGFIDELKARQTAHREEEKRRRDDRLLMELGMKTLMERLDAVSRRDESDGVGGGERSDPDSSGGA
jgi:hypothetical protein